MWRVLPLKRAMWRSGRAAWHITMLNGPGENTTIYIYIYVVEKIIKHQRMNLSKTLDPKTDARTESSNNRLEKYAVQTVLITYFIHMP